MEHVQQGLSSAVGIRISVYQAYTRAKSTVHTIAAAYPGTTHTQSCPEIVHIEFVFQRTIDAHQLTCSALVQATVGDNSIWPTDRKAFARGGSELLCRCFGASQPPRAADLCHAAARVGSVGAGPESPALRDAELGRPATDTAGIARRATCVARRRRTSLRRAHAISNLLPEQAKIQHTEDVPMPLDPVHSVKAWPLVLRMPRWGRIPAGVLHERADGEQVAVPTKLHPRSLPLSSCATADKHTGVETKWSASWDDAMPEVLRDASQMDTLDAYLMHP